MGFSLLLGLLGGLVLTLARPLRATLHEIFDEQKLCYVPPGQGVQKKARLLEAGDGSALEIPDEGFAAV